MPNKTTSANPPDEKAHKILARAGLGPRRQMEELIARGEVTINGEVATVGARARVTDTIRVGGRRVEVAATATRRVLLYNKPKGKWVTREDGVDSVFDDLPPLAGGRWLNVGRLDVNSEGLILFSNDGEWVNQMAHPGGGHEREYHARVSGELTEEQMREIRRRGVWLGGDRRPLRVKLLQAKELSGGGRNTWYRVVLTEGRHRAVRRLFAHYDLAVARLIRVRFGPYRLPPTLPPSHHQET